MSLLAMNSLNEEKDNDGYHGAKNKRLTSCATRKLREQLFSKEKI